MCIEVGKALYIIIVYTYVHTDNVIHIAILFFQIITAYLHMVVQLNNLVSDYL